MIFLAGCTNDTYLFDHRGYIIHTNNLTSVRVEPTNAACPPSTAMSDALNHYITKASPKKDTQVARRCSTLCKGVL